MSGPEIKKRIDEINELIEKNMYPNKFTLNDCILKLTNEIFELQKHCIHEFEGGFCKYCYKGEKD